MTAISAIPPADPVSSEPPLFAEPPLTELAHRALGLVGPGRALLGIVGEPGAGKSTFAEQLLEEVEALQPGVATAVSMDGFHLAQKVIDRREQTATKGSIETFDAHGFVAMLHRTVEEVGHSLWWPEFRRQIEEPVAGATEVTERHRLVIIDGNFLLADLIPWNRVRGLLTETWFLEADPDARRDRLLHRYLRYGFTAAAARNKVDGVDERTSEAIRETAGYADLVLVEGR